MNAAGGADHRVARLRQTIHPVDDVAAAADFYRAALGLSTVFVDADRYAALDAGGATLALTGPAEDLTVNRAAAAFKVTDLAATVEAVVAAGGTLVRSGPVSAS